MTEVHPGKAPQPTPVSPELQQELQTFYHECMQIFYKIEQSHEGAGPGHNAFVNRTANAVMGMIREELWERILERIEEGDIRTKQDIVSYINIIVGDVTGLVRAYREEFGRATTPGDARFDELFK